MESDVGDPLLYQVTECPIDGGPVFPLKKPSGKFFFFAPCCGVAWATPPSKSLDEVLTLSDFVTDHVELPARDEVVAAGFDQDTLTEWPYRHWAEDIPIE